LRANFDGMTAPEYLELPAPPPLDALIHCFWFLRGPMAGAEVQSVVPDGRMEIVLHLGETFSEVGPDGVARPQGEVLLAGQLTSPFRLLPRGPADVVGIRFRSAGARSVLGFPAAEATGRVERLSDYHPRLAGELMSAAAKTQGRKDASTKSDGRVAALAGVLSRFAGQAPPALVAEAVRWLDHAKAPPVHAVAARLGVTPRTLERRVLHEVGLSPQMLRRVCRFRRAFRLLEAATGGSGARVAAAAGYFDQAHLIREFRRFAGAPPTAFLQADPALSRVMLGSEEPAA
jgi:AraC-like DNA-binding protein